MSLSARRVGNELLLLGERNDKSVDDMLIDRASDSYCAVVSATAGLSGPHPQKEQQHRLFPV